MMTVSPFLMFEGRAEEAMALYVELIPNSEIVHLQRDGPDGPGAEGTGLPTPLVSRW